MKKFTLMDDYAVPPGLGNFLTYLLAGLIDESSSVQTAFSAHAPPVNQSPV